MNEVRIRELVDQVGGEIELKYCVADGGKIIATTAPGCWGPMITPRLLSSHEVTPPVYINGAKLGDSIAIKIEKIKIISKAAASGVGGTNPKYYDGDPSVYARCYHCNIHNPDTYIEGIGMSAIKCKVCGNQVTPHKLENGYTAVISDDAKLAVIVEQKVSESVAWKTSKNEYYLPEGSKQHLATIFGRADFSDLLIRSFPMIGNIGCSPAKRMPASKNAGDYYETIKKTTLFVQPSKDEINDAHMDINLVGEKCIVISPVLIEGAGVYFGDVHFTQGEGELAGHTLDVSAEVEISVKKIDNLCLEGPIIIPSINELNPRFRPFSEREYNESEKLLKQYNSSLKEKNYPIIIVGSGTNLNEAIDNAINRAAKLTGLASGEIMNRATVGGEVGIGRTSGLAYLTLMLGEGTLESIGILEIVKEQYN